MRHSFFLTRTAFNKAFKGKHQFYVMAGDRAVRVSRKDLERSMLGGASVTGFTIPDKLPEAVYINQIIVQ